MRARLIGTCCLVLALAGCGGGSDKPVVAAPTIAPTTASPTPAPLLTVAQAKATYLRIVAPSNAGLKDLRAAFKTNTRAKIQKAAARHALLLRAFSSALLTTPWPAEVAPNARGLAGAVALDVTHFNSIARATTSAKFDAAMARFEAKDDADGAKYAELIRTQLGLPSAPE